jgi:hypothetical protein
VVARAAVEFTLPTLRRGQRLSIRREKLSEVEKISGRLKRPQTDIRLGFMWDRETDFPSTGLEVSVCCVTKAGKRWLPLGRV